MNREKYFRKHERAYQLWYEYVKCDSEYKDYCSARRSVEVQRVRVFRQQGSAPPSDLLQSGRNDSLFGVWGDIFVPPLDNWNEWARTWVRGSAISDDSNHDYAVEEYLPIMEEDLSSNSYLMMLGSNYCCPPRSGDLIGGCYPTVRDAPRDDCPAAIGIFKDLLQKILYHKRTMGNRRYILLRVDVGLGKPIKELQREFAKIIQEERKSGPMRLEYLESLKTLNPPNEIMSTYRKMILDDKYPFSKELDFYGPVKIEEMERYLLSYKQHCEEKRPTKAVIREWERTHHPSTQVEAEEAPIDVNVVRAKNMDIEKAKRIIGNVRWGVFPGPYDNTSKYRKSATRGLAAELDDKSSS